MKKFMEVLISTATTAVMLYAMFNASLLEMAIIYAIQYVTVALTCLVMAIITLSVAKRTPPLAAYISRKHSPRPLLAIPVILMAAIAATVANTISMAWLFGEEATVYHAAMLIIAMICTRQLLNSSEKLLTPTPA